jgi:tetratricopeptide (TPR) repeat protein
VCGSSASKLWLERLRILGETNPEEQWRVAQTAVDFIATDETLWLEILRLAPPHHRNEWTQKAVLACSHSEALWEKILEIHVDPKKQSAIIKNALKFSENKKSFPKLWARLASLEPIEVGWSIFKTVTTKFPSKTIFMEAACFSEKHIDFSAPFEQRTLQPFEWLQKAIRTLKIDFEDSSTRLEWVQQVRSWVFPRPELRIGCASAALLLLSLPSPAEADLSQLPSTFLADAYAEYLSVENVGPMIAAAITRAALVAATRGAPSVDVALLSHVIAVSVRDGYPYWALSANNLAAHLRKYLRSGSLAANGDEELVAETPGTVDAELSRAVSLELGQLIVATLDSTAKLEAAPNIALSVAKAFYELNKSNLCSSILEHAVQVQKESCRVVHEDLIIALAKVRWREGNFTDARHWLERADLPIHITDRMVKKRLVLLRSVGELKDENLADATKTFPRSWVLWLMRVQYHLTCSQCTRVASGSDEELQRIQRIRSMYREALAHLNEEQQLIPFLSYVALRVEVAVFRCPFQARALVDEYRRYFRTGTGAALLSAKIEAACGSTTAAFKCFEGVPLKHMTDECAALMVSCAPAASKGALALRFLSEGHAPGPLLLMEVARIYHAAGKYQKALAQARKAVQVGPRCGDAHAMVLRMLQSPEYFEAAQSVADGSTNTEQKAIDYALAARPNSGPQWIFATKEEHPEYVTLCGCSEPIDKILRVVSARIEL